MGTIEKSFSFDRGSDSEGRTDVELPELPDLPYYEYDGERMPYADLYDDRQMREYARQAVLMERERCDALCDAFAKHLDGHWQTHGAKGCANLIRGKNEFGDTPDSKHFAGSFGASLVRPQTPEADA